MGVHAIVPTRDFDYDVKSSGLDKYGVTIHTQVNGKSIFQVIENFLYSQKWSDDDIIILMHDDIEVISNEDIFEYTLEPLSNSDTGFVGVAGTQFLKKECVWWEGVGAIPSAITPLAGNVYHGNSIRDMQLTHFGPGNMRQVVVMDGIFLAAKVSTWKSIRTMKPKEFTGDWDFYDIYFTFQAYMKGLKNYVMPLTLRHESHGDTSSREGWHKNKAAFQVKYDKHLPLFIP